MTQKVSARRPPQRLVQQVVATLPPVRGINSMDPIAQMQESDAIEMDNMVSMDAGLAMRKGWREYAVGLGKPIRTLMSYESAPNFSTISPLAESLLFAATDSGIYLIEGGGNFTGHAPDIPLSGAQGAGRFSWVQFSAESGGQYLCACSETDGYFLYDGIAWKKVPKTGTGSINGVDPALLVQVCAWKERLLFVERATTRMWVTGPGAVTGSVGVFEFGPYMHNGGALLGVANWTQDAGSGIDDQLVALGSSGDLTIFQGTNPLTAGNFSNVGTWYIGQPPVGRRCFTTSGGNVFILTQFGVIPVAQVVQGGLDNILTSDTDYLKQLRKIQAQLAEDFSTMLNLDGWELLALPAEALLWIARPSMVVNEHVQYAFQQHALAWNRMLDIPARTFARRLNQTYAGTEDARVLRILDGSTDGMKLDGSGAHEIRARLTPAFSYFGDPTTVKQALMIRPDFLSSQTPTYSVIMNADFSVSSITTTPVVGTSAGSLWDQAYWDQAMWIGGRTNFSEWRSIEALGFSLAPSLFIAATLPTTLASIRYMVKRGGPL